MELMEGRNLRRRPTIKDVAREADVSHATVSYVLSNNRHADRISDETKQRILEVVKRLGYKSNPIGRALKRGYTNSITLLIVTWNLAKSHSATAMAISRAAAVHDFQVTVHVADTDLDAEAFLKRTALNNIGGLLILWDSPALQSSIVRDIAAEGLPVVDLLPDSPEGISAVTADREDAGYRVTRHLMELGHRRIGVICDTSARVKTTQRKLAGYRRALGESDIEYDPILIESVTEFGFEGGCRGFHTLRKRAPDMTGVFCINDPMALGVLVAASEAELACPADISVVGYGASPEGEYWRPRLTTVELSANRVATRAVELIAELRENPGRGAETILIPGDLIVRESTGPAPVHPPVPPLGKGGRGGVPL